MAIKIQGTTVIDDSRNLVNINSGTIAGIQSGGAVVGAGATTINFIGAGNTFSYNPATKTLDVSIQGGGGIGISSDGVLIGAGITSVNFAGPGVATVTADTNAGIATILFEGGGGGSTIDKQSFNVGAAGTDLLTLTNAYTSGNIDVYLNGLKLSPGDFSELTGTTVGLTTAAVSGDTIDVVSFRSINLTTNTIGIQSGGVSIGGTFSTLNFIGAGNTFRNLGNGIVDISIKPPDDTFITNLKVSGIETATKLHVGIATTFSEDLVVSGNARITGILTIGTGTITLDGSNNTVNIGTGVTITSAGQIQATSLRLGGTTVVAPGVGIQSAGLVIGAGVTTLNFIGAGNTFRLSGSTVDISISGGGGGSLEVRQAGSNVGYSVTVLDFQTGSRISAAAGIATVNSTFNRVNYIFN